MYGYKQHHRSRSQRNTQVHWQPEGMHLAWGLGHVQAGRQAGVA